MAQPGFQPRPASRVAVPATRNAASNAAAGSPASQQPISPGALPASVKVQPKLLSKREKILIAADSYGGKTFAVLTEARRQMELAKAEGRDVPQFYYIDTDDTLSTHLSQDPDEPGEFADLYYEVGGNVRPYPAFDWSAYIQAFRTIQNSIRPHDYLVIDVINRGYDQAQRRVAQAHGKDLVQMEFERGMAGRGFGAFEPGDWNVVTRTFGSVFDVAIGSLNANQIYLAHLTDMVDAAGRERQQALVMFDQIGKKPRGPKTIYESVNTVMILYAYRRINRDEKGKRQGGSGTGKTLRMMILVKDRGQPAFIERSFDQSAFDILRDIRREAREARAQGISLSPNATGDDALELMAELDAKANPNEDDQPVESVEPLYEPVVESEMYE